MPSTRWRAIADIVAKNSELYVERLSDPFFARYVRQSAAKVFGDNFIFPIAV